MRFPRQEYGSGLPFPSPVGNILSGSPWLAGSFPSAAPCSQKTSLCPGYARVDSLECVKTHWLLVAGQRAAQWLGISPCWSYWLEPIDIGGCPEVEGSPASSYNQYSNIVLATYFKVRKKVKLVFLFSYNQFCLILSFTLLISLYFHYFLLRLI